MGTSRFLCMTDLFFHDEPGASPAAGPGGVSLRTLHERLVRRRALVRSIWLIRSLSWVISSVRAARPALVRVTQVRPSLPA